MCMIILYGNTAHKWPWRIEAMNSWPYLKASFLCCRLGQVSSGRDRFNYRQSRHATVQEGTIVQA